MMMPHHHACSCNANDGHSSLLDFSLASPDLVVSAGSPDIPGGDHSTNSPHLLHARNHQLLDTSMELSFENGISGAQVHDTQRTPSVKFSSVCQIFDQPLTPQASFELPPPPAAWNTITDRTISVISINAGSSATAVASDGVNYLQDNGFAGGEAIQSDVVCLPLYQTARVGNFSYNFAPLDLGDYVVDLHFAEIVFANGPPGMRVFDVFIQEQKVISCLDIYARVGGNEPLVVSGLRTSVDVAKEIAIRFEGLKGSPILCGIFIRKVFPMDSKEVELHKAMEALPPEISESSDNGGLEFHKLQKDYEQQKTELAEARRALEELKRENQQKSRECHKAWKSLQDLQNELMRKSMHVGSLASAIEGQVREKSRWFSLLRNLTRKVKIMEVEHAKVFEEALLFKKCIQDVNEMRNTILHAIKQQSVLHEDLKTKFIVGTKEKKVLYNKLLEMKGNIRVFCRCRPLNMEEISGGASIAIDFEAAKDGELTVISNGAPRRTFKFDAVFGPQANQGDVFEETAPLATSVLDGYNVCIFAYGQTGTGKTFTMEGTKDARGVNFRILEEMFCLIRERENLYRYDVSVSVIEVYNEQIRDLLVSGTQPVVAAKRLEVRQVSEGMHHVPGLVEASVSNMNEVWEVLQTGSNARAVGSTNANEHSSRSHCMHCVMVKGENLLNGECTNSKLWLVDLAGSERVTKTEVQGERLKETQNINRSLSALGDVISALATKSPHVPFRNSKLTHLLQDSLGGHSKTLMFVQISPKENDLVETLCSLNFASRVRGIELGPAKRQFDTSDLLKYKQMAEKCKQDIKSKDLQIRKMEEKLHGLDLKVKEKDLKNKTLQDKIKELESQLLIERKLARQHVDTKIAEQQQQHQIRQQQDEQRAAPMRPPLVNQQTGSCKNLEQEEPTGYVGKAQVNIILPLTENNSYKPQLLPARDGSIKHRDYSEKENDNEMAEQPQLPKRTGRASICTVARQIPAASVPRRISLLPLPSAPGLTQFPPPAGTPLPSYLTDKTEDGNESETSCLPEQTPCDSPKEIKNGGKKLSSVLRRSLQKKIQMKSPMQKHMRKGGVTVGMEKVRVSIGSRGKMGQMVLLASGRRGNREPLQKKSQKEKERGWNIGTSGRSVI